MLLTELLPFGCVYGEQTVENDLSVGSSQGFTSNETLQDSSELDSSIAKDIDIVEQEGFISGQLTDVTRSNDGLSINYSKISISEGYSFQLTSTAPSGANIDWHSNNTSVATVSGGNVTAVKAGKATIMVSYFDSSSNFQSATCTVYVVPSNIGVCYIKNNNSNLYLNLKDGKITNNTQIIQYTKYTTSNSNYNEYRVRQLWRVTYMDDGYYSIRPYAKSDRAIFANGNNTCINTAGYSDTLSDMLSFKWTIKWDGSGYIFQYNDSDSYTMQVYNGATTSGAIIKASSYSADNKCRWTFTKVTDGPNGLMMYTSNGSPLINSPQTKYIAPESTKTLVQMDYQPVCYARVNLTTLRIYQNAVRWYSSSTSKANVDSTTGAVTGVSEGSATIEARVNMGVVYSVGYTLNVTNIPEGIYFIQNREYQKYLQIDDGVAASTSGAIMEQHTFSANDTQRWNIILLDNGYYRIVSEASGYALSVPSDSTSSEDVPLVQQSYVSAYRQQWKFILTENGSYKIKARSSEGLSDDLVMVVGYSLFDNSADGIDIEQRKYVSGTSYKDEWLLMLNNDSVALETQHTTNWCWVASARMMSMHYMLSPITQEFAAVHVKTGSNTFFPTPEQLEIADDGGSIDDTVEALEYIIGSDNVYGVEEKVYGELALRDILDNSGPVLITRGNYVGNNYIGGHFYVIYDYHLDDQDSIYWYDIYDPLGQQYSRTYNYLINGNNSTYNQEPDLLIWDGVVVYKVGNYQNLIDWIRT